MAAFFLVLLRVAIGWHFGYEGLWKIESWQKGSTPFSAEGYLRNASGPLAPVFRGMVPDVNGLAKLDPTRLTEGWRSEVTRIGDHFGFNDGQRQQAKALFSDSEKWTEDWFLDRENREKRQKYYHDLGAVQKVEKDPAALTNERDWAAGERHTLEADRKDLTKDIDARAATLRESVIKLATKEQVQSAGGWYRLWPVQLASVVGLATSADIEKAREYKPALTLLDLNNYMTAGSLVLIGFCLIAGLFTRLAALGGVGFLALIYLCMPPWPGLPPNPLAEGHFLYVDKNLVELFALLAIAALPTGHWIGLDALLFGWRRRRRELRREESQVVAEAEPVRGAGRRAHSVS